MHNAFGDDDLPDDEWMIAVGQGEPDEQDWMYDEDSYTTIEREYDMLGQADVDWTHFTPGRGQDESRDAARAAGAGAGAGQ